MDQFFMNMFGPAGASSGGDEGSSMPLLNLMQSMQQPAMAGMGLAGMGIMDPAPIMNQPLPNPAAQAMMNMMGMGMGMTLPSQPRAATPTPAAPPQVPRAAPSAAAGSAAQLAVQMQEISKSKEESKEDTDDEKGTISFKAYMKKLKEKKRAGYDSGEGDESVTDEDEDCHSSRKRKRNSSNKIKTGRPRGSRNRSPLKDDLKDQLREVKSENKLLKAENISLRKEVEELKLELKRTKQGLASETSEVIVISDDDEEFYKNLPMNFNWDEPPQAPEIENDPVEEPAVEAFQFQDYEDEPDFMVPDDDYGHLSPPSPTADTPFVQVDTVSMDSKLKCACKACDLNEAAYFISGCNHFGICEDCKAGHYKDSPYERCPGCGDHHTIVLEKLYIALD